MLTVLQPSTIVYHQSCLEGYQPSDMYPVQHHRVTVSALLLQMVNAEHHCGELLQYDTSQ